MLRIVPCTIKQANAYIKEWHRHNGPVLAARIALAVADDQGNIHGVGIAGRPNARMLDDGYTLEAERVCTDGQKNACSMIYAALWRAARAIGYTSMVTYTLTSEPGTTMKAVNWRLDGVTRGDSWDRPGRRRKTVEVCLQDKYRWRVRA